MDVHVCVQVVVHVSTHVRVQVSIYMSVHIGVYGSVHVSVHVVHVVIFWLDRISLSPMTTTTSSSISLINSVVIISVIMHLNTDVSSSAQ